MRAADQLVDERNAEGRIRERLLMWLRAISLAFVVLSVCPITTRAEPVTWDFYETGITCPNGICTPPTEPLLLASLTLPGPAAVVRLSTLAAPHPCVHRR